MKVLSEPNEREKLDLSAEFNIINDAYPTAKREDNIKYVLEITKSYIWKHNIIRYFLIIIAWEIIATSMYIWNKIWSYSDIICVPIGIVFAVFIMFPINKHFRKVNMPIIVINGEEIKS